MPAPLTTVVIATRDRRDRVVDTVGRLLALPDRPPVIVVDDASTDGTADAVRALDGDVRVVALADSHGPAPRTVGAREARTPFVAFSDDDSWWAPGALDLAADCFATHPRLALLAARILVGADERLDPTSAVMARSPLPADPDLPGPSVLGFLACGAIVRRDAFLAVGGFHPRFGIGGEEQLLAIDLAAAGGGLAYVGDVVAHHVPEAASWSPERSTTISRNDLWTTWMRRSLPVAARATREAGSRQVSAAALGLPWILRERRPVPDELERRLALLEG